jgi:serine protease Do
VCRRIAVAVLLVWASLGGVVEARPWGWLGVRIRDLSELEMEDISRRHGIREGYGVVIVSIMEDSPAARSAIRPGDIVVGFAERPIVDSRMLQRVIGATPIDHEVRLTVLRPGEGRRTVTVRLGVMPPEMVGERVAAEFGFYLREVVSEQVPGNSLGPIESAAVVGEVLQGSPAARGGLRVGDVLRELNGEPLPSFGHATRALARAPLDQPLRLGVARGDDERLSLALEPPPVP